MISPTLLRKKAEMIIKPYTFGFYTLLTHYELCKKSFGVWELFHLNSLVFSRDIVLVVNRCNNRWRGCCSLVILLPGWLWASYVVEPSELSGGIPFMRPFQIKVLDVNLCQYTAPCGLLWWVFFTWIKNIIKRTKRDLVTALIQYFDYIFSLVSSSLFIPVKQNLLF